jgi:hypothetical protein
MADPTIKCVVWDLDNTVWDGILLEDASVRLKPRIHHVLDVLPTRDPAFVASRNDRELR